MFVGLFRILETVPGIITQFLDAIADVLVGLFRFVVRGRNRRIAPRGLALSKPRTIIIYYANCRLCSERFENPVADVARRLRAEHMQRTHGIYDKDTATQATPPID